jgi:predicted DCC family thiol-disulfide oxidoreductase YuxK
MTDARLPGRERPVLLYDGACGLCTRLVEQARDRLGADVDYLPLQTAPLATYGVSSAEARRSLHLVSPGGRISQGGEAVARLLVASGGAWSLVGRLLLAPPFSFVAAAIYWLVASNRARIPVPRRRR